MHKEIDNMTKKKSLQLWHLYHSVFYHQCILNDKKKNIWENKIKNTTSNMRSQNEVIQVQCVEIKLKDKKNIHKKTEET